MKFTHPNGRYDYVMVDGSMLIGEIELPTETDPDCWVSIGYVGSEGRLFIDSNEWSAFMALVKEIDEACK